MRTRPRGPGIRERIIAEELRRQGWSGADLAQRRKSDPVKLELATRLRRAFAAAERLWAAQARDDADSGVRRGAAGDGDQAEYRNAAAGIQTPDKREEGSDAKQDDVMG
jgi:hypothetical protein